MHSRQSCCTIKDFVQGLPTRRSCGGITMTMSSALPAWLLSHGLCFRPQVEQLSQQRMVHAGYVEISAITRRTVPSPHKLLPELLRRRDVHPSRPFVPPSGKQPPVLSQQHHQEAPRFPREESPADTGTRCPAVHTVYRFDHKCKICGLQEHTALHCPRRYEQRQ